MPKLYGIEACPHNFGQKLQLPSSITDRLNRIPSLATKRPSIEVSSNRSRPIDAEVCQVKNRPRPRCRSCGSRIHVPSEEDRTRYRI